MAEKRASFWRRNRWIKWVAGCALVALAALAVVVSILLHRAEPYLRARIVETLQDRFHARVELDSFHMSLVRGLQAEGHGLRIWPPAQVEGVTVPAAAESGNPLIRLDEFRFHAPIHYQPGKPFHISAVELKGLEIDLPPRSHFVHAANPAAAQQGATARVISFGLDAVECTGAHFVLETSKPGKLPLDIAIARFKLTGSDGQGVSTASAMKFEAELTSPRPVGTIHSTGTFGPWLVADPGESPIQGEYQFDHADLAGFNGIAGILSSTGKYQGTLRELVVDGETDTPDFRLTHFGNALPLQTHFHAKVDATNGDTWLDPVDATLGHSHFTVQGQVVRVPADETNPSGGFPASKGHDIALNVDVDGARIEDFLHLASHSATPLLTGALAMKAALHIPPGPQPLHERLNLKGAFNLDQASFASAKIQDGIRQLSLRGQGLPKEIKTADATTFHSAMRGDFQMASGVITLPALTYTVPGATIQLKGTYGVEGSTLDFAGSAKMDATVSQMVGGVLGALLKPTDRFFRKNGAGTEVPIHISGTREDPRFGIDFGRMRSKSLAEPPTDENVP